MPPPFFWRKGFFSIGKNELRVTRSSKISVCSAGIVAGQELLGISSGSGALPSFLCDFQGKFGFNP